MVINIGLVVYIWFMEQRILEGFDAKLKILTSIVRET